MAVSPLKYACVVKMAPLMNEDLTAASLKYVAAVRFADLTKQEMAARHQKERMRPPALWMQSLLNCAPCQRKMEKRNPESVF